MDIGNVRPAVAGLTAPVPKAPAAEVQAAPTEVPVRAAVNSVGKSDATRTEDRRGAPVRDGRPAEDLLPSERQIDFQMLRDQRTEDIVFRWIDVDSGDVVRQYPEEALLRMRAMADAWSGIQPGRTPLFDITA